MDTQVKEMLRLLDESRAALESALATVPPEARGRKPAPGRWSVAEILEHLALVNARFASMVERAMASADAGPSQPGLGAPLEATLRARITDRSEKRQAPEISTPTGRMDADTAWTELLRAHDGVRALLEGASGRAFGHVRAEHPRWGQLTVCQYAELFAGHEQRHAAQIRELAGV